MLSVYYLLVKNDTPMPLEKFKTKNQIIKSEKKSKIMVKSQPKILLKQLL
jgi:hypothetical protein